MDLPLTTNPTSSHLCDGLTSTLVGDNLYVYGGYSPELLWRLHLPSAAWTEIECVGSIPPPRQHHATVTFGNHLLLTGGEVLISNTVPSGKLISYYELSLENFSWRAIDCFGGIPLNRSHHTAEVVEDKMYVFGGKPVGPVAGNDSGALTAQRILDLANNGFYDLYIFDVVSRIWRSVEVDLPQRPMLWGHSAVQFSDGFLLFYGGLDVSATDTRVLDRYGTPLAADDPPVAAVSSSIYIFDIELMQWEAVTAPVNAPTPRAMHVALECAGYMVVFGGFTVSRGGRAKAVNDCWMWNILKGEWSPLPFWSSHWPSLRLLSCVYHSQIVVAPTLEHLYYIPLEEDASENGAPAMPREWTLVSCTQSRIDVQHTGVHPQDATEHDKAINPRLLANYQEISVEAEAAEEPNEGAYTVDPQQPHQHQQTPSVKSSIGTGRHRSVSPGYGNTPASTPGGHDSTNGTEQSAMAQELALLHEEVRRLCDLVTRSNSRGRSAGQSTNSKSPSRSNEKRRRSSKQRKQRIKILQDRLKALEESVPTSTYQSDIDNMRSQSEALRQMIGADSDVSSPEIRSHRQNGDSKASHEHPVGKSAASESSPDMFHGMKGEGENGEVIGMLLKSGDNDSDRYESNIHSSRSHRNDGYVSESQRESRVSNGVPARESAKSVKSSRAAPLSLSQNSPKYIHREELEDDPITARSTASSTRAPPSNDKETKATPPDSGHPERMESTSQILSGRGHRHANYPHRSISEHATQTSTEVVTVHRRPLQSPPRDSAERVSTRSQNSKLHNSSAHVVSPTPDVELSKRSKVESSGEKSPSVRQSKDESAHKSQNSSVRDSRQQARLDAQWGNLLKVMKRSPSAATRHAFRANRSVSME